MKEERTKAKMGRSKYVQVLFGSMIRVARRTQKTMIMLNKDLMILELLGMNVRIT